MKKLAVLLLGILSLMYLLNIGVGFFELIPDNIPFVGNLDEATATMLLLNCLHYFGVDMLNIFNREKPDGDND